MIRNAGLCIFIASAACVAPGRATEDGGSGTGEDEASSGGADAATSDDDSTSDDETTGVDESSSDGSDCPAPRLLCGEGCVDLEQDELHCGECGSPCAPGQLCAEGVCECPDARVACDGLCIDPLVDPNFCGAALDCTGDHAGEACSFSEVCDDGACVESCDNCGFERGDFSGWTLVDLDDPFVPLTVGEAGTVAPDHEAFGFFVGAPPEGTYAAYTGMDGTPGTISIGQDITIGAGAQAPGLVFTYRAAWTLPEEFGSTQDRVFSVSIQPPGGGPPFETIEVMTMQAGTTQGDTGAQVRTIDLSSYVGEDLFVAFEWVVPETFTGPAFCELDDVRLEQQL